MAKINFNKLGIKKVDDTIKTFSFNDLEIEVKQYLPIQDKLTMFSNAINLAADGNRFLNEVKLQMFLDLEVVFNYTNVSFTDKQKEDLPKLYDMLISNGFIERVYELMPEAERVALFECTSIANGMYNQMNSIYGIMENVAADYANVGEEATDIQKKLSDPKNLTLLKDVVSKLG